MERRVWQLKLLLHVDADRGEVEVILSHMHADNFSPPHQAFDALQCSYKQP